MINKIEIGWITIISHHKLLSLDDEDIDEDTNRFGNCWIVIEVKWMLKRSVVWAEFIRISFTSEIDKLLLSDKLNSIIVLWLEGTTLFIVKYWKSEVNEFRTYLFWKMQF
jgi:hypothetical protein